MTLSGFLVGLSFYANAAHADPDLIGAATEGNLEAVVEALEANSDGPKALSRPLFFAAQRGHAEVVKVLLEHGADANTSYTFGSPIHAAARANDTAVVALLLENGTNPDLIAGDFDQSPIHEAAARAAIEAAELLIEHGADVNFRNNKGRPPIHAAAMSGKKDMVDFLRINGATPNLPEPITQGELENANIEAGRRALHGCNTCHETEEGKPATGPHVGPTLVGVFGAKQAASEDFAYSSSMTELDGVWGIEDLNAFLSDPTGVVPGTAMLRVLEMTREERIGLIAFLRGAAR
ncbi:ankyrin repeat domain-containing protein [Ruegeria meonggei]|uniref:ankyrin repeat domain-containing protein n=1 Tax=Ruegeria meonggei TaxID=1446476 RepID=UPI00366EC2AC